MLITFTIIIWLHFTLLANAANILVLDTLPAPSHHHWTRILVNGIAENSKNNITVLSLKPDTRTHRSNIHYIHLENVYEYIFSDEVDTEFNWVEVSNKLSAFEEYRNIDETCVNSCFG